MSFAQRRASDELSLPRLLEQIKDLGPLVGEAAPLSNEIAAFFPKTKQSPFLSFVRGKSQSHDPLKVGVLFSGGQAAGGHNVIAGLFDALERLNDRSRLFGFLGGPIGLVEGQTIEMAKEILAPYRNQGGFDLLGSGREKIETKEQFLAVKGVVQKLDLDGIVMIGGDDSSTNAALLAEFFCEEGLKTRVVGVPKTIDGDLRNHFIEIPFGFDTATKSYSAAIASVMRDALSAKKYYFFIKLMGRSASHIALECALQTHPTLALIGEEIAAKKQTFQQVIERIADLICVRAVSGRNYGVVLVPEGVLEFIPEFRLLIGELNGVGTVEHLSSEAKRCFDSLPEEIQQQLLLDRDPHGNVRVSQIETEKLFITAVSHELKKRKERGHYGEQFRGQPLFFGYEGRCCFPSLFDCHYCYALGQVAALLVDAKKTGYLAAVRNLVRPVAEWELGGVPINTMVRLEERQGVKKPVVAKTLVDLSGAPFSLFAQERERWSLEDCAVYPGPIQFFGDKEVTDAVCCTVQLEAVSGAKGAPPRAAALCRSCGEF